MSGSSKPVRIAAAALLAAALAGCSGPKVTYKGLKLNRQGIAKVTDRDVDQFLSQIRSQMAKAIPLPPGEALKAGDRAVIDFAGTVGGSAFTGGTATAYPIVLGTGQMIPGFEEGIIGMHAGQVRDIKVTFPKDYNQASLAGRAAVFHVTVRGGESLTRPPLDDDFARKVSGGRITSVADLRKAGREQVLNNRMQQAEASLKAQAAELLLAQWPKAPSSRDVTKELDRLVQQQLQAASQRGMGPAQGGPDADALRLQNRPAVERSVKLSAVLASIARQENVVVTDAEVEQMGTQMAQQQGQDPQQFLAMVKQNKLMDVLRRRILEDRIMTIILQNAMIAEPGGASLATTPR
jgi:trigger factor